MTKRRSTRTVLCGLLGAAILALGLASSASARPFQTGIVVTDTDTVTSALAMQRIKDAGNSYVKISVFWPQILKSDPEAPTKPAGFDATNPADPLYDWSSIDTAVRNAKAAGLQPLLVIGNDPRWARATGDRTCRPRRHRSPAS